MLIDGIDEEVPIFVWDSSDAVTIWRLRFPQTGDAGQTEER
jgi:hypothetical protein